MEQENREQVTRKIITYSLDAYFGDDRIVNGQMEDNAYHLLIEAEGGTVLTGDAAVTIGKGIAETYNVEHIIGKDLVFGMLNVLGISPSGLERN